jgi:type II secretory pathway predicted ATPase ExeA
MYKPFFGLRVQPFGASPDPRFLFLRPQIKETLACLQYSIAARKGLVALTGEAGTGKTTLLQSMLSTFSKKHFSTSFVFNPRLDALDFLEFVLTDFGIPPKTRTKSSMLIQLNGWLIERFRAQQICVIIVDEAQDLSPDMLEEIRLLTNLETSSEKLVQIVLAGQPELEEMLYNPNLNQLRQRISNWCKTRPLTSDETHGYITERLRIAGAAQPVFQLAAIDLVYHYSQGIPRIINLLCEHSLVNAYAEQVKPIPVDIVEAAGQELNLVEHPYTISVPAIQSFVNRGPQAYAIHSTTPATSGLNLSEDIKK